MKDSAKQPEESQQQAKTQQPSHAHDSRMQGIRSDTYMGQRRYGGTRAWQRPSTDRPPGKAEPCSRSCFAQSITCRVMGTSATSATHLGQCS